MSGTLASRIMPRTTVNLDPSILRELKRRAEEEGKSLGDVISEVVAAALSRDRSGPPELRWQTAKMGPPKVDLEDDDAVRKAVEER
jgi:hypothetical protein